MGKNELKGNVKDKSTNNSIVFANIYFPQLEKGTSTDNNGNFNLKNIPTGTYK